MSILEEMIMSGDYTYSGGQRLSGTKKIVFERGGNAAIDAHLDMDSGRVDLIWFNSHMLGLGVSHEASAEFADAISHYWSMI